MGEKILVASVKQPGRVIKLGPKLAAHLVSRGTHEYVTQAVEPEGGAPPPRARKRTYRRRDLRAEE